MLPTRKITEYDLKQALESLLEGEFLESLKLASGELETKTDENRDCQIAIRVASSIALLTMNTEYRTASIDELIKDIYFIKNETLKSVLKKIHYALRGWNNK